MFQYYTLTTHTTDGVDDAYNFHSLKNAKDTIFNAMTCADIETITLVDMITGEVLYDFDEKGVHVDTLFDDFDL